MTLDKKLIVADGQYFDLDCYQTQLNNNVLVVGTPGSGKTRKVVTPNILQAVGSYVIVDPKGDLHEKYGGYLKSKGYQVRKLNFACPDDPESCSFNFFDYIHNDQDILKIAHMLVTADDIQNNCADPYWDEVAELLLVSLIGYLYHYGEKPLQNLHSIIQLIGFAEPDKAKTSLDRLFERIGMVNPRDYSYCSYKRFRLAPYKTTRGILISLSAKLAAYNTKSLQRLFEKDTVAINEIGKTPTAVFVIVSDTDRSMDMMVNAFFSLAINELCRTADFMPGHRLPVDTRFILDDFATNVRIADFPRIISSVRSRGISTMLIIQAESQLQEYYSDEAKTIIGNCDTYVYLGGNDICTADNISRRTNRPLMNILYMPVGKVWVFRRGTRPVEAEAFHLEPYLAQKLN